MSQQPAVSRTPNTDEMEVVKGRIQAVQDRRRERIPWHITKHTAELAIAALADPRVYRPSAKNRRRKKTKRLL